MTANFSHCLFKLLLPLRGNICIVLLCNFFYYSPFPTTTLRSRLRKLSISCACLFILVLVLQTLTFYILKCKRMSTNCLLYTSILCIDQITDYYTLISEFYSFMFGCIFSSNLCFHSLIQFAIF